MNTNSNIPAVMLVQTTEGFRDARTHVLFSDSARDIVAFAKKGGTTAGFSITYAVHADGHVVSIMKSGSLNQKDVKALVSMGFRQWHYSWAFAGKTWRMPNGDIVAVKNVESFDPNHLAQWQRAFGG